VGEVGWGFASAIQGVNKGRLDISGWSLGKSEYLLERMISYANERVAFGQPIGAYQFVQGHIVDSSIEIEMVRGLVLAAAEATDTGSPDARRLAASAKVAASETFGRVADRAIQVHGGNGLTLDLGIERFYRDARAMRIYEGTSELLRANIATWLGLPG
jgi:acyl-CoA dehydrogenase